MLPVSRSQSQTPTEPASLALDEQQRDDVVFWQWMVPALRDGGGNRSSLAFGLAYASAWTAVAAVAYWRGVLIRL